MNKKKILLCLLGASLSSGVYADNLMDLNSIDGLKIGEEWKGVDSNELDPKNGVTAYRDAIRAVNNNVWYLHDNILTPDELKTVQDDVSDLKTQSTAISNRIGPIEEKATDAYNLATTAGTTADNALQTANSASTSVATKADASYVDTQLATKTSMDDVRDQIAVEVAENGQIYNAISLAAEEDGPIAKDIEKQVTDKTGSIYDAIVNGSSDAITTAIATGGAIDTSITTAVATKADTSYVDGELSKKADATDLGKYSTTESLNTKFDAKADKTTVSNALAGKANQTDFSALETTVLASGSGLATKVNEQDVAALIQEAMTAPDELDRAGDDNNIRGLIYNAVADATGDLAVAVQKNIENSQSGAIAAAVDTKISTATNTGVIKTALDTKASDTEFKTVETKVNDATTGLDSKVATTTLQDNYTPTTGLGAVVTETMGSGSGLAIVTAEAQKVSQQTVTDAVANDGAITKAVTTNGSDLANAIDSRISTTTPSVGYYMQESKVTQASIPVSSFRIADMSFWRVDNSQISGLQIPNNNTFRLPPGVYRLSLRIVAGQGPILGRWTSNGTAIGTIGGGVSKGDDNARYDVKPAVAYLTVPQRQTRDISFSITAGSNLYIPSNRDSGLSSIGAFPLNCVNSLI